MKRRILLFLLLFLTSIIVSKSLQSQVIIPGDIISGDYEINANKPIVDYSQKILKYNDIFHIALTTIANENVSRFYLIEQGENTSIFANIDQEYKVKDF